ncbi:MAG: SPASM domain-containing protein [Candidatus Omnitrophota bacterium]
MIAEKKLAILTFATNGFSSGSILKSVRRLIPAMRNTKLIITCSLDGTKEVHDKLRGVSGAYDRCLETFTQLRAFKTVNAYLGVTVSKENHLDLPLLLSDLKKKIEGFRFDETHFNFAQESFFYNNVGALPSGRVMDNEVYMSVQALRRIHKKNNKKFKDLLENRYFEFMPKYLTEKKAPLKCSALGGSCFIDPYGDIYPCMGFEAKIGNLSEAGYDLKEFWKLFFKRKDEVRKSIQEHKCPGCWTACEAYPSILNNLLLRPQ